MAKTVQRVQAGRVGPKRSRFGPTVVTVILLGLLAVMAPYLAKHRDAPEVWAAKLEAMSQNHPQPMGRDMKHDVWVNRRSGLYYCRESRFYGRMRPGVPMRQESALLKGFRPAEGQECQ